MELSKEQIKKVEDFVMARNDVLDLMEQWSETSSNVRSMICGGMSVFIRAALDMAPCRHAVMGVIADAMNIALDEDNEETDK